MVPPRSEWPTRASLWLRISHVSHPPFPPPSACRCLIFADTAGDGDHRLVAADADRKLRVFRGTSLEQTQGLADEPTAAAVFYPSGPGTSRGACVAVAAGSHVFVFRLSRPYYKFTLPAVPVAPREAGLWDAFGRSELAGDALAAALADARDDGVPLSARALDVVFAASDAVRAVSAQLPAMAGNSLLS